MKDLEQILNVVSGNTDESEKKEILEAIKKNKEHKAFYKKAKLAWALAASSNKMSGTDVSEAYFRSKEYKKKDRSIVLPIKEVLKYVAVIAVAFTVSWGLFNWKYEGNVEDKLQYTTVMADNGQVSKVLLPDSTIVWLNSGSKLTYSNAFSLTNRDLNLSGQAYLHVKRNESLPLIVSCNELKVKVLGTKFDVKAYPDDDQIQVMLEEGSVELLHSSREDFRYLLKPGQLAIYSLNIKDVQVKQNDSKYRNKWTEGVLQFNNEKMFEVIKKLERKYGIKVQVKDTSVYESRFNGRFKNESLEQITRFIEIACKVDAQILKEDDIITTIILMKKGM